MNTYRIVIRIVTTEDFEFKVEANTREEARGRVLALPLNHDSTNIIHRIRELKFVSNQAIKAATNPPEQGDGIDV